MTFFLLGPKDYGAFETGATGLAVKMVFMQFLSVNIQLWFNAKFLKLPFKNFLFHQFFVLLIFVSIAFGCSLSISLLLIKAHFLIQFLISGIVYAAVIFIVVWRFPWIAALKRVEISDMLRQLRNKWPRGIPF